MPSPSHPQASWRKWDPVPQDSVSQLAHPQDSVIHHLSTLENDRVAQEYPHQAQRGDLAFAAGRLQTSLLSIQVLTPGLHFLG